jgi:phosphatidylserine decarboxylase
MGLLKNKLEQYRQAYTIHGSVLWLFAAALAVKLSRVKIPTKRLRLRVYRTIYGKKYPALDEAEFEKPMWAYPSINALFTRGLRPELRPIPQSTDQFLSPCDGRIQDIGRIQNDTLMTVKGVEYSVRSLLAQKDAGPFQGGNFAIIFLSPSDCHRIFSPQEGMLEKVVHVPGYRLLVHPPFQRREYPVFTLNERVILRFSTPLGACALVLVAGWGVGNITLPRDRKFRPRRRKLSAKAYDPAAPVQRGDWIATFELGSTAILLTEGSMPLLPQVGRDDKVRYGQPIFSRGGSRDC